MFVNNINLNKTNFGAKPLYNVKLKKLNDDGITPLKATFSRLSPKNEGDYYAMENIACNWNDRINGLNYTPYIFEDFMGSSECYDRYYAVELIDKTKRLCERIKSIVEISNPKDPYKDHVEVYFLQTSPDNKFYDKIKGGGELALYGAVRLASNFGKNKIIVKAARAAMDFYEKVGLDRCLNSSNYSYSDIVFELPSNKFKSFINKIENKYEFGEASLQK